MREKELRTSLEGKRVLVTGHTGFKGAWLSQWLVKLGARVSGLALEPTPGSTLFEELGLEDRIDHHVQDIRERAAVERRIAQVDPDFVFHLAAQSLVRQSYDTPLETLEANILGTANLLEGIRRVGADRPRSVVVVTSDKCYQNREWSSGYRETDPLGGRDPYSASKAGAELVTATYRDSFFSERSPVSLASARAGNVIGGGDWAEDRILPDCIRSLIKDEAIVVRNPRSTRPWQHVLDPLHGYLVLASSLSASHDAEVESAFNFGPPISSNRSVAEVVTGVLEHWPGKWEVVENAKAPHEAGKLALAWDKAYHVLGWEPRWGFETAIERTVAWYRQRQGGASAIDLVNADIDAYSSRNEVA